MRKSNANGSDTSSGAGRLIIGLMCLCIIGGLVIYSFQSAIDRNEAETGNAGSTSDFTDPADVSVSSNIPVKDSLENNEDSKAEDTEDDEISVMPAEGNIIRDYSGNSLVYSETLNQYLAHKAVDIGAAAGTEVISVESGTVTAVENDDRYGLTVTVSHGGGLETSYGNLQEAGVAVGDVVNKGDRIGTVGEGALFESADDPHLHFAVHKDGKPVDPHDMWNW
jgi:murein DD-endopeptidase MepM/ murein hydrolase activator NlpD